MFPSTKGQWLQDSPAQRAKIISTMVNWKAYSNSSPVEGIGAAVQGWWAADKKISVYVIGDDFTGGSIEAALSAVRKYNPIDRQGRHRIRIHAIGMPDGPNSPPFINSRFAALMRAMCDDNEGTFVGLTIGGPSCAIKIDVLGTAPLHQLRAIVTHESRNIHARPAVPACAGAGRLRESRGAPGRRPAQAAHRADARQGRRGGDAGSRQLHAQGIARQRRLRGAARTLAQAPGRGDLQGGIQRGEDLRERGCRAPRARPAGHLRAAHRAVLVRQRARKPAACTAP